MKIETASGLQKNSITREELLENLNKLDESNDYLILSDGEDYIQCAYSEGSFLAEYQDSSGHFSSESGIGRETIEKLFSAYFSGDGSWKSLVSWSRDDTPAGSEGQAQAADHGGMAKGLMGDLSPEKILGSVKKQVQREVGRSISRKTNGLVSKVIKKFLG